MRSKHRSLAALIVSVCALSSHRADAAASMLRCEADDSSVSYVSAQIDHATCHRVELNWRSPASAPSSAAAVTTPQPVALRRREATARICTCVEDGVRHYLTQKPLGVAADVATIELHFMETCNLCGPAIDIASLALDTRSYGHEIDAASASFGVDSALVRAVIHAESAYRANAISRAGAQGLMQLMPATAARFEVGDPFDAAQNIRGGGRYLSRLLRRFNGNRDLAIAAYNSGEMAVDRYKGVPPYDETLRYVARVKTLADPYRAAH